MYFKMKKEIESYWENLKKTDQYHINILSGNAKKAQLVRFLTDAHYLVKFTPIHLELAASLSEGSLKAFYENKLVEEKDHYVWSDDGLNLLGEDKSEVSTEIKSYVSWLETLIRKDPRFYLVYIFFAEYLCVLYSPEIEEGLIKSGFDPKVMSIISNHAELDKYHVSHWKTFLEESSINTSNFLEVLEEIKNLETSFYRGLVCKM